MLSCTFASVHDKHDHGIYVLVNNVYAALANVKVYYVCTMQNCNVLVQVSKFFTRDNAVFIYFSSIIGAIVNLFSFSYEL